MLACSLLAARHQSVVCEVKGQISTGNSDVCVFTATATSPMHYQCTQM